MNIEIQLNLVDENILSKTGKETKEKKIIIKTKVGKARKRASRHQMPKPRAGIDNTVGDTACRIWD